MSEDNKETTAPATTTGVATTTTEVVHKVPKFTDLIAEDKEEEVFKRDTFNWLVNQPPPAKWIKQHPMVKKEITLPSGEKRKVPVEYIPIEKVELLLTRIFQEWRVEILREGALFQSVYCTVRLHYKDPVTQQWSYHDGTAAVDVQTKKDTAASDLASIVSGAIQKGLPAAESYAVKDAAEKIGKIFGKDLNRADAIAFTMGYNTGEKTLTEVLDTKKEDIQSPNIPDKVIKELADTKTKNETVHLWNNHPHLHEFPEFKEMINKRRAELDLEKMQKNAQKGAPK